MENIYCAAIWYKDMPTPKYKPINIETGLVVEGHRHADIIRTMVNLLDKRTCRFGDKCAGESEQGFVSREEAAQIAFDCGQIKQHTITLYSEDIY
jgi:hypothetical protein